MKKLLVVVLAMLLVFTFAACGGNSGGDDGGDAPAEPVTVKIAFETTMDDVIGVGLQRWADNLEELSGGQMKAELFPSNQLGVKNDVIDQMLAGDNVITLGDGAFFADRGAPDFGITFAPYLYRTWDEAWTLVNSDWFQEQSEICYKNGLKILTANWIYGTRNIISTKKVVTPADLKGLLIRIPNNLVQTKGMDALGATATPMGYADIYTGLQQGTIDGMEGPMPQVYSAGFGEIAKFMVVDAHVLNPTIWFTSADWFDTLTEEQQNWLIEAGNAAGEFEQSQYFDEEEKARGDLEAQGVEITDLTDEQKQLWIEAGETFYDMPEIKALWTEDGLYEKIRAIIEAGS